jgi:hypothetical protein
MFRPMGMNYEWEGTVYHLLLFYLYCYESQSKYKLTNQSSRHSLNSFAYIFAESLNVTNTNSLTFVIKTYISNLVHTTRFWNNLHQVRSNTSD